MELTIAEILQNMLDKNSSRSLYYLDQVLDWDAPNRPSVIEIGTSVAKKNNSDLGASVNYDGCQVEFLWS